MFLESIMGKENSTNRRKTTCWIIAESSFLPESSLIMPKISGLFNKNYSI